MTKLPEYVQIKMHGITKQRHREGDWLFDAIASVQEIGVSPHTLKERLANGQLLACTKAQYNAYRNGTPIVKIPAKIVPAPPKEGIDGEEPEEDEDEEPEEDEGGSESSKDELPKIETPNDADLRDGMTIDQYWENHKKGKGKKATGFCPKCPKKYRSKAQLFVCCIEV